MATDRQSRSRLSSIWGGIGLGLGSLLILDIVFQLAGASPAPAVLAGFTIALTLALGKRPERLAAAAIALGALLIVALLFGDPRPMRGGSLDYTGMAAFIDRTRVNIVAWAQLGGFAGAYAATRRPT